jgi:hypothetical protein
MRQTIFRNFNPRPALLIGVEHALIVLSVLIAAVMRLGYPDVMVSTPGGVLWRALLIAAVLQVCLHYSDLYELRSLRIAATCSSGCFARSVRRR